MDIIPTGATRNAAPIHQPAEQYHRSAPAVVEAVTPGQLSFVAQVWQPGYDDGDGPTLVLTISDDLSLLPYVHTYDLEAWQVRGLIDALLPLLAHLPAGGDR